MTETKVNHQEQVTNEQQHESSDKRKNGEIPQVLEEHSDVSSNPDSISGSSAEDESGHGSKKPLSKQPSNGIHVLKPDESSNGVGVAGVQREQLEEISFDPNGSYYMANACCELVHYRWAAVMVGVVELALIALWGALIGYYYHRVGIDGLASIISISMQAPFAAILVAIIILMLTGVLMEKPALLWPHMIVQMIGIFSGIAFTVLAVIAMCAGTSLAENIFSHLFGEANLPVMERMLGPIWPFCLAVVFDFAAALRIWFYIIIKGCYEYLLDKAFFEELANNASKKAAIYASPKTAT